MKAQNKFCRYLARIYSPFIRGQVFILFFLFITSSVFGQDNILSRVSATERGDNKGYVVRYHLAQKIDSFRVFQPIPDLIQMTVYSDKLDTTDITVPAKNPVIDEISFYKIPRGIGVDIYISKDTYFKARAYGDGSSNDLLLGLSYTSKKDLEYFTEGLEPVIWSRLADNSESLIVEGDEEAEISQASLVDDGYREKKDKMKFDVVVIDPGHGGHDPGSIGYKGVKEKDIVLSIAKKVGAYIEEYIPEVKVVYTRKEDKFIDLYERGPIANRVGGDLFVSIHCNSFHSSRPNGTEVYFLGMEKSRAAREVAKRENQIINSDSSEIRELTPEDLLMYELANSGYMATSEKIAGMIEHQLSDRAMRQSRGVKQARFVVLHDASMPSILVETGFITNPSEQRYLSSDYGQSIIASAIFRAIRNYKEEYEKSQHFNTN